eukprot:TRINITY_DN1537_c0_g4_i1.p1 TRINITY_DN1537_c0_g4~~TRINITY_DN1537_c0_g4_i1.p1  ORF type:complete len:2027 (+),score=613.54 TRINITY_DN1537_c0_g4_i1:735-6083(+)
MAGHVIACRITAENPDQDFQPTSGMIQELNFRSTPDVWGYFSVSALGGVHEYADSQFGHLFAVGETREIARRNMVLALKELSIRGEIRTTVEYLHRILETEDYRKNRISTTWLEKVMAQGVRTEKPATKTAVLMGAIYKAFQLSEKKFKEMMHAIENGRLLKMHYTGIMEEDFDLIYENIKYPFHVIRTGSNSFGVSLHDWYCEADFNPLSDGGLYVSLEGRGFVVYGHEGHLGLRVIINGQTCVFSKEYDPSELRTEMAGKLIRFLYSSGDHVLKGSAYAEMEVMKMCIPLFSPEAGVLEILKPEGSVVAAGDLLAALRLDDPNQVKRAVLYEGGFDREKDNLGLEKNSYHLMIESLDVLSRVLSGYKAKEGAIEENLKILMTSLRDPKLAHYDFEEVLSVLIGRIPQALHETLSETLRNYARDSNSSRFFWEAPLPFPILEFENALLDASCNMTAEEKVAYHKSIEPIRTALDKYTGGSHGLAARTLTQLLKQYLSVEEVFVAEVREDFALQELRATHKENLGQVAHLALAHAELRPRNSLVIKILEIVERDLQPMLSEFHGILSTLTGLTGTGYSDVVWKARQVLLQRNTSVDERRMAVRTILNTVRNASEEDRLARLQSLVEQSQGISDILLEVCFNKRENQIVKGAASEVYIRRNYRMYNVADVQYDILGFGLLSSWTFARNSRDVATSSMKRVDSFGDISRAASFRRGYLAVLENWDAVKENFSSILSGLPDEDSKDGASEAVIHIAMQWMRNVPEDRTFSLNFYHFITGVEALLRKKNVRRLTFIVNNGSNELAYFTYRAHLGYNEDQSVRHVEPTMARQMELDRLLNYSINYLPTNSRIVHLFSATPLDPSPFNTKLAKAAQYSGKRLFARVLVKRMDSIGQAMELTRTEGESIADSEYAFVQALNSLEISLGRHNEGYQFNHVFLNFLVEEIASVSDIVSGIRRLASTYEETIRRLHVSEIEFRMAVRDHPESTPRLLRFVCSNSSGYYLDVDCYEEIANKNAPGFVFQYVGNDKSESDAFWSGKSTDCAYPLTTPYQFIRQIAHRNETVWAYDFIVLIRQGLMKLWRESHQECPNVVLSAVELVLDKDDELVEVSRPIGKNDIGMIAWRLTMFTPEYPSGREVVLIANDITHKAGSFGPREDLLFFKASKLSRDLGLPRLYFAANSGARIGLATELMSKFRVSWVDEDPLKGHEYLYLVEKDYNSLKDSVNVEPLQMPSGEIRYVIKDIIGKEFGIGVENLSGSGMIAGETSSAYDEVFTLSYVTGRCVGIGAYLVRLGQRVIQKVGQPILLTGYRALNKLLGREVYTSNAQLGGTAIMFPNGVSHLTVQDDMEGVFECLRWLSYVPSTSRNVAPVPSLKLVEDPVDRVVESVPRGGPCDPRDFIAGVYRSRDNWVGGLFDKDSFKETLGGWAQTIVCGRARLGGIPVGVVSVETRTRERTILADPANPESKEFVLPQAGQVWFPDSSYKTSQAIFDMNREGLPLFILANWRGFSGGMRDMFDEIVKYGAYIVDGLREYKQPIFVYIVPHGELRGGAWVVLDPTINPKYMEMYADPTARGGILEPAGILDIKFRPKEVVDTAHRLDPLLNELKAKLTEAADEDVKDLLKDEIKKRERVLHSSYHQVAMKFADLHDTPGRMVAVKSISSAVDAKISRAFFYWRLRLRMELLSLERLAGEELPASFLNSMAAPELKSDDGAEDKNICLWLENNREIAVSRVNNIRVSKQVNQFVDSLPANSSGLVECLSAAFGKLSEEQRSQLLQSLASSQFSA